MIVLLSVSAACVVLIVGVALALPCAACRKRRERIHAAYAAWKARPRP
jgi:hypothetical protein